MSSKIPGLRLGKGRGRKERVEKIPVPLFSCSFCHHWIKSGFSLSGNFKGWPLSCSSSGSI